jgi:hypothetical protein
MSDESTPPKGHVKIAATIPAAVVAAVITVAGNWFVHSQPTNTPTADDVRTLRDQVTELKITVATLSGQLATLAEDAKNQKVIEALRQGKAP